MHQRDYMLRLIEQMTAALSVVMGLKREKKEEQALAAVDESLGRFFRLNAKLVNSLAEKDLLAMLTVNGFLEAEKAAGVALLLKAEGEVLEEEPAAGEGAASRHPESLRRYRKALSLLLEAAANDDAIAVTDLPAAVVT